MHIKQKIFSSSFIESLQNYLANDLQLVKEIIKDKVKSREEVIPVIADYIFASGGKKIRPILTILSAKLFNYKGNRHINLAVAVEFIHTATLLHDDVVDQSSLRRGKPSVNHKWDNKTSILIGDYLFSQAFCIMSEDGDLEILDLLSKTSAIIAEGEVMQISSQSNLTIDQNRYFEIIKAKTAELFAASCQIGAIITHRAFSEQMSLRNFGFNLGIAFQIIDDMLDYRSDQMTLGKSVGNDFAEAKVTLPIILLYQQCNQEEKEFLNRTFVLLDQQHEDFKLLIAMLEKYKIFQQMTSLAEHYLSQAKQQVDTVPNSRIKLLLTKLLTYSLIRNS